MTFNDLWGYININLYLHNVCIYRFRNVFKNKCARNNLLKVPESFSLDWSDVLNYQFSIYNMIMSATFNTVKSTVLIIETTNTYIKQMTYWSFLINIMKRDWNRFWKFKFKFRWFVLINYRRFWWEEPCFLQWMINNN